MYRVLIFTLLLAVVAATNVQKCSGKPSPLSVRIKGCNAPPCQVRKGSNQEMEVDFLLPRKVSSLKAKVMATALGVTVPYELPENIANVCKNLLHGASCPLDAGEDATYKFIFPIGNMYPEIGVKVEVTLVDEKNSPVTCFAVDIKVTK